MQDDWKLSSYALSDWDIVLTGKYHILLVFLEKIKSMLISLPESFIENIFLPEIPPESLRQPTFDSEK